MQIQELIDSVYAKYREKIEALDKKRSDAIHSCIQGGATGCTKEELNSIGKLLEAEEIDVTQKYYTTTKELESAFKMHMTRLLRLIGEHAE